MMPINMAEELPSEGTIRLLTRILREQGLPTFMALVMTAFAAGIGFIAYRQSAILQHQADVLMVLHEDNKTSLETQRLLANNDQAIMDILHTVIENQKTIIGLFGIQQQIERDAQAARDRQLEILNELTQSRRR